MTDHRRHHQHYHQQHHWTCGGGDDDNDERGDGDHQWWLQRRHHRKATGGPRKYAVGSRGAEVENNPRAGNDSDGRRTRQQPPPQSSCSFSKPSHRSNDVGETYETVEWETMFKHFSGLPPFIGDSADKFKTGYPQTNIPYNHHLQYYSDLHQLHQVAYASRNSRKQQQSCCKPWQWNMQCIPSTGTVTNANAYYLSDPKRYEGHVKQVTQDDLRVNLEEIDQLSSSVWRKYLSSRQSDHVYDAKMAMWCKLSALIKSRVSGCGLYLVGSTMNGFGVDVSDADFCMLTGCKTAEAVGSTTGEVASFDRWLYRTSTEEQHRLCVVERLRWLMALLEHEQLNGNVLTTDARIVYAKVPILKFRWIDDVRGKIDVDLCCNSVVGIRNTHLLYCYSRLDYRVRPLVLTVKLWASFHNINDPKKMTLSSYSLALMVINFLQCVRPPVLPSLQCIYGMKFSSQTNIEFVHMHEQLPSNSWRSDNKETLGELLLKFFEHYNEFNFYIHAVSVRMGTPVLLEHCRMDTSIKNDPGQWKFIGIEEPFERTNTARSVHNHNIFAQIKKVINKSYNVLKETKSLDSIFHHFEK